MALFLVTGCGSLTPGSDEPPILPNGIVPAWFVGTWYSIYNLTRTTITDPTDGAQYSYTYDDTNEFRGGIDVDETGGTIHYAETYYWDNEQWTYDEDPYHIREWYVYSGSNLYTGAFFQDMEVYVRTAGTANSLVGTWEWQMKRWYGSEEAPSCMEAHKWVLTLNADLSYTRQKFLNDELLATETGVYTYGDINPEELHLSVSTDIGMAWVTEDNYLVMAPRFETQGEVAMIKQ